MSERSQSIPKRLVMVGTLLVAMIVFLLFALLMNIQERKQEARHRYVQMVEVTEDTTDPEEWAKNWPRQYGRLARHGPLRVGFL